MNIDDASRGVLHFIVRMCGIVGGLFTCAGLLHRFLAFLFGKLSGAKENVDTKMSSVTKN